MDPIFLTLLGTVGINVLIVLSLWVPAYAGVFSLGLAGFMATGALLSGFLRIEYGLHPVVGGAVGVLAAGMAGLLVGLLALRVQALYLAIGSLALGQLLLLVLGNSDAINGLQGVTGYAKIGPGTVWSVVGVALVVAYIFYRSTWGRIVEAGAQDAMAARSLGIPVSVTRVWATAVGAALSGTAGVLFAHYFTFASTRSFDFGTVVTALIFLVIGGNSPGGVLVGTVILTMLPHYVRFLADWQDAFYALVVLAVITWRGEGLLPRRALLGFAQSPGELAPGAVFTRIFGGAR